MKQRILLTIMFLMSMKLHAQQFHSSFLEEFNNSTSEYFRHGTGGKGADFTWRFGADSPTEPGTKILLLKIDPEDVAGAGRGPDIFQKNIVILVPTQRGSRFLMSGTFSLMLVQ
jgi:hypothetical protein